MTPPKINRPKALRGLGPSLIQRIQDKVQKCKYTGCWNWLGYRDRKGYGQIKVDGKAMWAHRVSACVYHGRVRSGQQVDHLCGNPSCVNPEHLECVSPTENRKRQDQRRLKKLAPPVRFDESVGF